MCKDDDANELVPLCEIPPEQVWEAIRTISSRAIAVVQLTQRMPAQFSRARVDLHLAQLETELLMLRTELKRRRAQVAA